MKNVIRLILVLYLFLPVLFTSSEVSYVKAKTVDDIITEKASQYGIKPKLISKIIRCESNFNPNAINSTSKEYSVGLSQINLKAHKNITKEQAQDPDFAIDFLAKNLSEGKGNMWTCYTS